MIRKYSVTSLQVSLTETLPSLMGDYTPQLSVLNKQTGQYKIWDQTQPKGTLQKAEVEESNQSTHQAELSRALCHWKEFLE